MSIPLTGPVTLSDLQIEFGGTDPVSLNEYYRGGAYVPDSTRNANIPTSGAISLDQFHGSGKAATVTYNIIGGGGGGGFGVNDHGEEYRGTYAGSGGSSTISGTGVQTITAAGGQGGQNCQNGRGTAGSPGASSAFGSGGYGGPLNSAGGSAASTSYGAGGGGGGGDDGSTFDAGGCSGGGGAAGTNLSSSVSVIYGTTLTIVIGSAGAGEARGYPGGNGAGGRCQISWDGNTYTYTTPGTYTRTIS